MKLTIPLFAFLLLSCSRFALVNQDRKWMERGVGFGCAYSGQPTQPVASIETLLQYKRFDEIRKTLNSGLPADQFLSVYLLEKLSAEGELEITEGERVKMAEIKKSHQKVPVCSGCTYWDELPLKTLFEEGLMSNSADYWFKRHFSAQK